MDFNSMGSLDAQNDIKKSGIDTSKGELKSATIRLTAPFLDLLTHVAEKMGMSRQAFMSKLIEQMASEAVAEYLSGYGEYMNIDNLDGSMFLGGSTGVDSALLNNFIEQTENNLLRMRLSSTAINALPDENPLKAAFFQKTLEREYNHLKISESK